MLGTERVATGVAVLLCVEGKILLGRRFEANQFVGWQCPGGYLLKGQCVEQSIAHYCVEKAGIKVAALQPGPYSNNVFSNQLHTATLYMLAHECRVINEARFSDEKAQWRWFDINALPDNLYLPLITLFKQHEIKALLSL